MLFTIREIGGDQRVFDNVEADDLDDAKEWLQIETGEDPDEVCETCNDLHWSIMASDEDRAIWGPTERSKPIDDFSAILIAEGVQDASEEDQIRAWQHLIDTKLAWTLQGFFGRAAQNLIEQGVCHE